MSSSPPLVGIVMGSKSDWDSMRHSSDMLTKFGVAHERADLEHAVFKRDCVESCNAVDVDQQAWCRQSHIESRKQALSAGEQASLAILSQQCDGLVERARLGIGEWRRFHNVLSP